MKRLLGLLLLLAVFQSCFPQAQPNTSPTPATQATNKADPSATISGSCAADNYRSSNDVCVHRPVKAQTTLVPNNAIAQCHDGSYSFSQHRQGTCSHHGGVAKWLRSEVSYSSGFHHVQLTASSCGPAILIISNYGSAYSTWSA